MTALLPGSSSAGALPPGRAGGAMVTGGASMLARRGGRAAGGAATSDLDAMEVHFLSERALCTMGANNFFLFT